MTLDEARTVVGCGVTKVDGQYVKTGGHLFAHMNTICDPCLTLLLAAVRKQAVEEVLWFFRDWIRLKLFNTADYAAELRFTTTPPAQENKEDSNG